MTSLHLACKNGDLKQIKNLSKKSNINKFDNNCCTPLMCCFFNIKIIKYLLEQGADPNLPLPDGRLLLSKYHDYPDIFELLLEYNATPHWKLLAQAINESWKMEVIELLLQYDAEIFCFFVVILTKKLDLIDLFLSYGAIPTSSNYFFVCKTGNLEIIKLFLKYDIKPELSLINDLQYLNLDIIEYLINENLLQVTGESLRKACKNDADINVIKLLVRYGANIFERDENGLCAINYAIRHSNNFKITSFLLENRYREFDIFQIFFNNKLLNGIIKLIGKYYYLITKNRINYQDNDGNTFLHDLLNINKYKINQGIMMELFFRYHIDHELLDDNGRSMLEYYKFKTSIYLLEEKIVYYKNWTKENDFKFKKVEDKCNKNIKIIENRIKSISYIMFQVFIIKKFITFLPKDIVIIIGKYYFKE
jgi:ankyrin repeat protein